MVGRSVVLMFLCVWVCSCDLFTVFVCARACVFVCLYVVVNVCV